MEKNKYLRFRPTFQSPLVYKDFYFDISNSDLCVWKLPDFTLVNCYPKVSEAYYIKLRVLTDNLILIAENDTLKLFDLVQGKIIDKAQDKDFIDYIETNSTLGIAVTVMAGENEESKTISKWVLENNTLKKVGSIEATYDCDITEDTFTLNVFSSGKIYLYRKGYEKIYQVVVEDNDYKKNNVPASTLVVLEMNNKESFALAQTGKISINDPIKGSVFGNIQCEDEIFNVMIQPSINDSLITSSNKAVKLWVLQSKTEPKIYQKSDKFQIDRLYIYNDWLVGISTKTKTLAIWNLQTQQLIKSQKISRQEIQKSFKLVDNLICLVIKIFDQTEESLSFHNRLELIDVTTDKIIASKEVKNASYQIEVQTIIPVDKETIRFICSSDKGEKTKSYLFTWRPFIKQQKKDMSKIEASKAPITKLYPYDRLLLVTPPKEKTLGYQTIKKSQHVTLINVHNHALKKLFSAQVEGHYQDVELSPSDKIYAIRPQTISIFTFSKPDTIELNSSIQLSILKMCFINNNIFCLTSDYDRALYDNNFELIMKQQGQKQEISDILQINKSQFIIVNDQTTIQLWNIKNEEVKRSKLGFEIVGLNIQDEGRLLITQPDRIERIKLGDL